MIAKRYMHLSGATSRDFGAISVADRKHAARNPKAYFCQKRITIEDHQNSWWIAAPLRLLDCWTPMVGWRWWSPLVSGPETSNTPFDQPNASYPLGHEILETIG
jgi:hypothetical protein